MNNVRRAFDDQPESIPYSERLDMALGQRDALAELYARAAVQRNWFMLACVALSVAVIYLGWFR